MQCLPPLVRCPGGREPGQCGFPKGRGHLQPGWWSRSAKDWCWRSQRPWVLVGGGQRGAKNKAHGDSRPPPRPGAWETQLEAARPARDAEKAAGSPRPELPDGDRGGNIRDSAGASPVSPAPNPEPPPPPSSVPGRKLQGKGRPPAPRFQSLAKSHGIGVAGDKPIEERRLLPQRRHRGGASSVGRGPLSVSFP